MLGRSQTNGFTRNSGTASVPNDKNNAKKFHCARKVFTITDCFHSRVLSTTARNKKNNNNNKKRKWEGGGFGREGGGGDDSKVDRANKYAIRRVD